MTSVRSPRTSKLMMSVALGMAALVFVPPARGVAQDKASPPDKHSLHGDQSPASGDESLAERIESLRAKVAQLEAALRQKHQGQPSGMADAAADSRMSASRKGMKSSEGMMGSRLGTMQGPAPVESAQADQAMGSMGMMGGKGMGMMDGMIGGMGMGGMSKGGGMGMMDMDMMGMMGQNPAGENMAMGGMAMPSALPGFPGASHLYHIGAAGFFLNHPQHITLTTEQQTQLNQRKEQSLLAQAQSQRKIDQAEQELWELTSADQPDATKIEAKVREIEKLRGDQRLAFIRSVGEAAKLLTPEQIKSLVGQAPPAGHTGGSAPQHQP